MGVDMILGLMVIITMVTVKLLTVKNDCYKHVRLTFNVSRIYVSSVYCPAQAQWLLINGGIMFERCYGCVILAKVIFLIASFSSPNNYQHDRIQDRVGIN